MQHCKKEMDNYEALLTVCELIYFGVYMHEIALTKNNFWVQVEVYEFIVQQKCAIVYKE